MGGLAKNGKTGDSGFYDLGIEWYKIKFKLWKIYLA